MTGGLSGSEPNERDALAGQVPAPWLQVAGGLGGPETAGGARIPERVPGFEVRSGRGPAGLPPLAGREPLGAWRAAVGAGPFFVRLHDHGLDALHAVRRLSTVAELWLEAPGAGVDEALDLLVAGAARLAVPPQGELLDAVETGALLRWDGGMPWPDVQALALDLAAPVLALQAPPADAACDALRFDAASTPGRCDLVRVASAPEDDGE